MNCGHSSHCVHLTLYVHLTLHVYLTQSVPHKPCNVVLHVHLSLHIHLTRRAPHTLCTPHISYRPHILLKSSTRHTHLTHEYISCEGRIFHTVYTSHTTSASQTLHICYVPLTLHVGLHTCTYLPCSVHLTCRTHLTLYVHTTPVSHTAHILCRLHLHLGPSVNTCLHLCV